MLNTSRSIHSLLPDTQVGAFSTAGKKIPLAVFDEHRLAFYFWYQWTSKLMATNKISEPPLLVTIDWHRDFAPPDNYQTTLKKLQYSDADKVAQFADQQLADYNDEQILAAAYLNKIGNIILLKNYGSAQSDYFIDASGNRHQILEYREYQAFERAVCQRSDEAIYLDIDLDYFIQNKVAPHQQKNVTLYADRQIREIINPKSILFQHLFPILMGVTIAKEPRYCGGDQNSEHIFEIVMQQLTQK